MVTAIILSGGSGTRLGGDIPKQYLKVDGRTVLSYSLEQLSLSDYVDAIWIVAADDFITDIKADIVSFDVNKKFKGFSAPGETRQFSILNGLRDVISICDDEDLVLIHDAARPLISPGTIAGCVSAAEGHDGVMPALPMKDTVYLSEDKKSISSLLDRGQVFAGQAPEIFKIGKYLEANERLSEEGRLETINGSSEPAVLCGMDVAIIPGDESNFKITTKTDLERFEEIIKQRKR